MFSLQGGVNACKVLRARRRLRVASFSTGSAFDTAPSVGSKHYEIPDPVSSKYQISYTLPPLRLDAFPAKLSNFDAAKKFYEQAVLGGNEEQKKVYVDTNAATLFNAVFPEIAESRRIGKIEDQHFSTWDYRQEPKEVLLKQVFRLIDRDENGTIEIEELRHMITKAGLLPDSKLFDSIDTDDSGEIDFHEWEEWWEKAEWKNQQERLRLLHDYLKEYLTNVAKPLVENNVEVLFQPDDLEIDEHVDFLCVGGPSTYASALLHKAQYPDKSILHVVGHRFDSNADGSAYYYHERDAFPLYVNTVNTGWYCLFADLYKRFRSYESLRNLCRNDRHHVKIALQWKNILHNPWMIFSIFIPNTYHAFMDLMVRKPQDSLMAQACWHSQRVPIILDSLCKTLNLPFRAFLIRDPDRAVYIDVEGQKKAGKHFDWLNKYANIPYHSLDPSVFGPLVTEALAFNRDGALNPWMFENFHKAFNELGIESRNNWFLDCLFVKQDANEPERLVGTAARFENVKTGDAKVISFDKMTFSLGPSGAVITDPALSDKCPEQAKGFSVRNALNAVNRIVARGIFAYKGTMWAAGSSSVCLLGIKRGAAPPEKLDVFRKFIDGVNQHWTLMNEREVSIGNDKYDFFVIQMTGGGNFPSRYTKPDFVLNLLYTTEAVFGLDQFGEGDILYDIVQSRGCGRSVSARNTIGFSPIAKNVVSAYGLGGIGMTTAYSNGALQLQILEALSEVEGDKKLAEGTSKGMIGSMSARKKLREFYGKDIFEGVNYQAMVDDPQKVARALGVDQRVLGKQWHRKGIGSGSLLAS